MIGEIIPVARWRELYGFPVGRERRFFVAAVVMSEKSNHKVTFDGLDVRCSCGKECDSLLAAFRDVIVVPDDRQKSIIATQVVLAFNRAGVKIKNLIDSYTVKNADQAMIDVSEAIRTTVIRSLALGLYDNPAAQPTPEPPQERPRGPKTIMEQEIGRKIIF